MRRISDPQPKYTTEQLLNCYEQLFKPALLGMPFTLVDLRIRFNEHGICPACSNLNRKNDDPFGLPSVTIYDNDNSEDMFFRFYCYHCEAEGILYHDGKDGIYPMPITEELEGYTSVEHDPINPKGVRHVRRRQASKRG